MPERLRGLWHQRRRWAQGGVEVLMRQARGLLQWRMRRMWGVLVEFLMSLTWSCTVAALIPLWALGHVVEVPEPYRVDPRIPRWYGVVLGMVCLLQFGVSRAIDRRDEPKVWRNYYWMIGYPLAYWLINLTTLVAGVRKALGRGHRGRAVWVSPDRGLR